MMHKNGTVGSHVGFRRGTAVYSISVSGFPRTFKNDGWHAVLRFLFVKGSMRGWWKETEFIMYHNYEVGNIVKRKGNEVLMEIISVCYDLFDKERTGYIICSRLDSNIREKLHVDDVEFVSIGNAQSYEFE